MNFANPSIYLHRTQRESYLKLFEKALVKLQLTPKEYKSFKSHALDVDGLTLDRPRTLDKMLVDFADGILEWTLNQEPSKQFELVEYILDPGKPMPVWVTKRIHETSRDGELAEYVLDAIEKIENLKNIFHRSGTVVQSAIISYFLTDSNRGLLRSPTQEAVILTRLTQGLPSTQVEMANAFYRAMKKTDPNFYTHMLARAVVLKNGKGNKSADPSALLVPIVEYFDVPGIKLAQMSHFGFDGADKMEGFEKFYESAVVLSNSQILDHIGELYGDRFPDHWKFVKPLGFGSANYAVLFYDEIKKQDFVLNIPRKNIAEISKQKFAHFQNFLAHLNSELSDKGEVIELLSGLSKFLKRSMDLEFDRHRVFQRTQQASSIYSGNAKGWKFRPVTASEADNNGVISMSLAEGESLASLQKSNPRLFKKSSAAIAEFLGDRLFSNDASIRLNTNGDWHPGQFFVDRSKSRVSILDFGQESAMTINELTFAKDVLTILSVDEFAKYTNFNSTQAFDLLKQSIKQHLSLELSASTKDGFASALSRSTPMARFVYLVSYLENQGIEVPVTSGHWIKEVNAILNFEREGQTDLRFSNRLRVELFNHLKERNPSLKINFSTAWSDRIEKIKTAFGQAKKFTSDLFGLNKKNQSDPNACLKFYE